MKRGLLLIQLGTPESPEKPAVRAYLKAFLGDPLVLDMPAVLRWLLLYGLILPFRTPKTAKLYQKIWTPEGSPLRIHSVNLAEACQAAEAKGNQVALGMRYGNPSIQQAVESLKNCDEITVLPLFPQYAQSSTQTALLEAHKYLNDHFAANDIHWIEDFHNHPAFIQAHALLIQDYLKEFEAEHLLLSFHGIPKHHLKVCAQKTCLINNEPCLSSKVEGHCYKAESFETARALINHLPHFKDRWSVAFQSRLGKAPWIGPELIQHFQALREKGITRLALAAPSFTADCLETLEELDIRAKEQWLKLGGTHFTRVPCLNSDRRWVQAVLQIARKSLT